MLDNNIKIFFSYFRIKVFVVGTQKNPLNETVLLSTQNLNKTDNQIKNFSQFYSTLDKQRICVNTQLKSSKKQLK